MKNLNLKKTMTSLRKTADLFQYYDFEICSLIINSLNIMNELRIDDRTFFSEKEIRSLNKLNKLIDQRLQEMKLYLEISEEKCKNYFFILYYFYRLSIK